MNRTILLGIGSGVLAGALWGLVFIAPRLTPDFSPAQISAARYLAYGAIAFLLLAPRWRTVTRKLARADWIALVWLGLAGNAVYYILLATGVQLAGPAPTSLIIGLLPVVVTVIGSREAGAVSLRTLWPSLLLGVIGVGLTAWSALAHGTAFGTLQSQALGLFCATGALACWTAFAVGNARKLTALPQVSSHDWSLLLGVVTAAECVVLAVPAFGLSHRSHQSGAWLTFLAVSGGVAILASVIGNALWNSASRKLPLTLSGQMIIFETLFALLYSFAWDGRLPTVLEVAAICALVMAVLWCASSHRVPATHQE